MASALPLVTDEPWRASCLNCIQSCRRIGCESLSFNNRAEPDSAIAGSCRDVRLALEVAKRAVPRLITERRQTPARCPELALTGGEGHRSALLLFTGELAV